MSKTALVLAAGLVGGLLGTSAPSFAQSTTTTTTTTEHHDDGPAAIVTAPARAAGEVINGVLGGPTDCQHTTVTKTDGDTGESVSKSRTDCN